MSSSATNMWRNYTGMIRLKYSNSDHVGCVCWWQKYKQKEIYFCHVQAFLTTIFLSSSSPVNTPNLCSHWLLCLSPVTLVVPCVFCSWWSPTWSKGPTIITSFCCHCITVQYCIAGILVGTKFIWRIGSFESNPPIFCLPELHSVMSSLLHNHTIYLVIHTNIIAQQRQCCSIRIFFPMAAVFWLSNVAMNSKALHQYLCATTLHGHNAMTKL